MLTASRTRAHPHAPAGAVANPHGYAGKATEDGETLASIKAIGDVVAAELEADGVLIAWHEHERPGRPLFFQHQNDGASVAETALAAAEQALLSGGGDIGPAWHTLGVGTAETGALTAQFAAGANIMSVTTLFDTTEIKTRARAKETLLRLWPVIRTYFGMWAQRLAALSRLRHLSAAVDHSDVGLILIDRFCRVVLTNSAADALLSRSDGLRLSGGTLAATRLVDTLRLQATVEHVLSDVGAGGTSFPVLALPRNGGRPLMAAVAVADDANGDRLAAISLFDPDQDLQPLLEPACKLYRLSPVEARLACLIADGISLGDAAKAMRVREASARSYLKQIFLKTDTRRQAELVRLMLKSAVRAAHDCRASLV